MPARQDETCDSSEDREILPFGTAKVEPIKEREDPCFKFGRLGDFKVEDTITAASHRPRAEDIAKSPWGFFADLRHVERLTRPAMAGHGHALDGWGH